MTAAADRIPQRFTPELQSVARIIAGFLLVRHGMEQWFGFPAAFVQSDPGSFYGALKLLALPGGILLMLGLFTRPVSAVLAPLFLIYWLAVPLPAALLEGQRLFGARGPSDPLLLNFAFLLYLAAAGPGTWSLDRLRDRTGALRQARWAPYALGTLRIIAGFLFLHHGIEKVFGGRVPLDPVSLRAFAALLENVGGPLLMLGLFTRPLAFLLSGEMAFAYFINHAPDGFWGSFIEPNQEAAILNCFLFLFMWAAGPGAWSVSGFAGGRPATRSLPSEGTSDGPASSRASRHRVDPAAAGDHVGAEQH
jgi:putative oxidoreductase